MFLKIGVLKNFTIFTEKQLCWSLFLIKLLGFRPPRKVFTSVHIVKILRTRIFTGDLWRLLFYYLIASRSVSYLALYQFFNLTFSFGRNIKLSFPLMYFSIYYFYSYFITITRLQWSINSCVINK